MIRLSKRLFMSLIALVLAFSVSLHNPKAITQTEVSSKLSELITNYVGKNSWPSSVGAQCYSFAHFVFNTVFSRSGTVGSYSTGTEYKFNNPASDINTLGSLAPGSSQAQFNELLNSAAPGDYMQVKRRTSGGPHSMIVVSVNGSSVEIFDANTDGNNTVMHYTQTYTEFFNKNSGLSIYRKSGYTPLGNSITISGQNAPGTLNTGDPFAITGTVSSGYTLTSITAGVYGVSGTMISGKTINPNSISYNLNNLSGSVSFSALNPGVYRYIVMAANFSTSETLVNKVFVVLSNTKTIENGTYYFASQGNTEKGLSIEGDSLSDGANVLLWQTTEENNFEKWNFEYDNAGYYKIINAKTGRVLDVKDGTDANRQNVWQWYSNESDAQRWNIVPAASGYYCLVPKCANGRCLEVEGGDFNDGTNIQIYEANMTNSQQWKFLSASYQDDRGNRIDFDLQGGKVDGSFADYTASGINIERANGALVIYNKSGTTVETDQYGVEAAVTSTGVVSGIREYNSTTKLTVPSGGFVISGHVSDGNNGGAFVSKISVGDYVGYDASTLKVSAYKDLNSYLIENKYVQNEGTYGALPIPEKDGYVFEGWYTSAEGGDRIKSSTVYSTSRLYARWTKSENARWVQSGKYNGHRYKVYDYSMSWKEAKELCESKGGHLVTITSKEENDFVTNLITKGYKGYYSIGCTDEEKEGTWKWVTGEAFSYSNWDPERPEPNNGEGENYGAMIAIENPPYKQIGEWIDSHNKYLIGDFYSYTNCGFVCEYENDLEITKQPEAISGKVGEEAALTIEADGDNLTYLWQESSDNGKTWTNCTSTGATTSTFTFTLTTEMDGRKYRCIVSDGTNSITSDEATVTVEMNEPVITKQPADITVNAGETTAVTVEVEGEDLTYQWQKSNDSGKTWSDCTSAEARMASFEFKATAYMDGRQFRCIVTNSVGSVTSETAVLTVNKPPVITKQPADITVNAGETTAVTVEAEGEGLTYQWQKSNDSGKTWSNCTSAEAKLASFEFKAMAYMDSRQFRCIITNSVGSVTSKAAVLTISKAPVITSQPEDVTGSVGDAAGVSVKATGDNLSYRWQKSYDSGKTWSNCTSASAAKATFSFTLAENMNGRMYRCVVSNENGTTTSSAVKVTVTAAKPKITKQPESTSAAIGEKVSMKVTAEGSGLKYQWQRSTDGGKTWANCTSTGSTSATFTFTMAKNFDGRRFRCRVSNSGGSVTSSAASVTLKVEAPVITKQPSNAASEEGGYITLSITATGENLKYQWQRSTDGGKTWVNCTSEGSTTNKFGFEMLQKFDGRMFRCRVSNSGGTVTSREVTVRII